MHIDDAISRLQQYKRLGATEIKIDRDFAPGGELEFRVFPAGQITHVVWITEVPDEITATRTWVAEELTQINKLLLDAHFPRNALGVATALKALAGMPALTLQVEELVEINELLQEHGFEYPTGKRGVRDVLNMLDVHIKECKED